MSAARAARDGAAVAESRMGASNGGSDAIVKRLTGNHAPDPFTGLDVPEFAAFHTGPMRLAANSGGAGPSRTKTTPGGDVTLAVRRADFPAATPALQDGDVIEITAGESVGTSWLVVEADRADQQTAYRVPVIAYH